MRRMLSGAGLLILAALVMGAGVATAGRPVHGAHYSGHIRTGTPGAPGITFDVSRNGAELQNLEVSYPPLLCDLGGMTPPQQQAGPTPISSAGTFRQTVNFATP